MKDVPETAILNYNLFGESGDLPDVAHCESIEARSRLHDWEFAPHRHPHLHQILFLEDGGGQATLEGEVRRLTPMTLLNLPAGCVHGFSFVPGTDGLVVTMAAEFLDVSLQPGEGLRQILCVPAVAPADADCRQTLSAIARTFVRRDFARAQMLRSLCGLLLGQIAHVLLKEKGDGPIAGLPSLLVRFEALLERHYAERWRVGDYADRLAITTTHLSRVVRQATGRPATHLIEERIIREARRNLVYTNLPISTIAYELGYEDPAHFSRVFSRATGTSPRTFRTRALGRANG